MSSWDLKSADMTDELTPDQVLQVLAEQELREEEALAKYPWKTDTCTYDMNVQRQTMFACLTCKAKTGKQNVLCYSCGVSCHGEHEIAELGTKRGLTCDCGTSQTGTEECELRNDGILAPAANTHYGHNSDGTFCVCNSNCDQVNTTMFQCLLGTACDEDWYHERCILGLTEVEAKQLMKEHLEELKASPPTANGAGGRNDDDVGDGDDDEDDDDVIYLPGIPQKHEAFICWKCVAKNDLERLDLPAVKAVRTEVVKKDDKRVKTTQTSLFLQKGYEISFKQLAKHDPAVARLIALNKFLVEPEETYEPPTDDDQIQSDKDFITQTLQSLSQPHAAALLEGFSRMHEGLRGRLREIEQEGRAVTEKDIKDFFASLQRSL